MATWIKAWWKGTYEPHKNDPRSMFIFAGGHYRRHWTSRLAHTVADFLSREWKWTFATLIALTGLIMTYLRFF